MTEAVEILIKADDQASAKFAAAGGNLGKALSQAQAIMRSLEGPADKYARQLEELSQLHAMGAISAEKFAEGEAKIAAKLQKIADDDSQKKIAASTKELEEEQRKATESLEAAEAILQSLEEPAEKYARKLEELRDLHNEGVVSAEKFAEAETKLKAAIEQVNTGAKDTGNSTKAMLQFAGTMANLTGQGEVAGFANQLASAADKAKKLGDASAAGGAGALALKLGLVGLAAGAGFALGKVLADWIWDTKKFEKAMQDAKEQAAALDQQLKELAQTRFGQSKEGIELIRDPDEKREAYKSLLGELERDIESVGARAAKSKREADEWADAWQITGNRKQYAEDAAMQAKMDQEQLDSIKKQAQELRVMLGARAQHIEQLKAENAAKDKSETYLETLRQELEYMQATREEQIKIDAARNTTAADRREAERLLTERDAINAKLEAEKELAAEQKRAQEDAARAAAQAIEDAETEIRRVKDLEKSIEERIELRRIELTQGKEAARVQELINHGIDAAKARQLAADEAALEQKTGTSGSREGGSLTAMESRLLTRGPASTVQDKILGALNRIHDAEVQRLFMEEIAKDNLVSINRNTKNTTQMVPVA